MRFSRARREPVRRHDADAELGGDLLGALVVELAREQRGALSQRQAGEVLDQAAHGLLVSEHGFGVLALVA